MDIIVGVLIYIALNVLTFGAMFSLLYFGKQDKDMFEEQRKAWKDLKARMLTDGLVSFLYHGKK